MMGDYISKTMAQKKKDIMILGNQRTKGWAEKKLD